MKCPECDKWVGDAGRCGCGWREDRRSARKRQWESLTESQDRAKRELWRIAVKGRERGWPQEKMRALARRELEKHRICVQCAHGLQVVERYDPDLAAAAKSKGWDPIMRPVEQRVAVCDRKEPGSDGRRCRLGSFRMQHQPKAFPGTLSGALAKRWEIPRMDKADGTVQRPAEDTDVERELADLEIPL